MMVIAVRQLRHRLGLLQRTLTPDHSGGFQETWQEIAQNWGRIIPLYTQQSSGESSKSIRLGGKEIQSLGYKVILQNDYLRPAFQRFVWKNRVFALTTQPEEEIGGHFMVCYASELLTSENKNQQNNLANDGEQ